MNHYQCIKVFIPKTNGIVTADTFQWPNDNIFQLLSISNEEQLATAVKNLAEAIKNEQRFNPPNTLYHKAVELLSKLFREKVDEICHQKMILLGTERIVDSTEHNLTPKDHNCDTST